MPGLTNEPTGIIDQPAQNVSSTAGASSSSSHADVYIIPDYSISRTHPQHILVLPFVPHPPTTAAASNFQPPPQPPPNYFCTNNHRASTPAYNDPPPDYEAVNPHQSYINHGASFESSGRLTPSCSCMTQLTSIADDCKFFNCVQSIKKCKAPIFRLAFMTAYSNFLA